MFHKKFRSTIASWFLKWWEMFGPIPQIFLKPLQDALRYFSSRYNSTVHGSQFPAILHMTTMYRIHWISMWKYTINNNLLDREFLVKWWDSLRFREIIKQIHKDFPPSYLEGHYLPDGNCSQNKVTDLPRLRSNFRKI